MVTETDRHDWAWAAQQLAAWLADPKPSAGDAGMTLVKVTEPGATCGEQIAFLTGLEYGIAITRAVPELAVAFQEAMNREDAEGDYQSACPLDLIRHGDAKMVAAFTQIMSPIAGYLAERANEPEEAK